MATLWEKIQFWKKSSSLAMYREDIDYQFSNEAVDEMLTINEYEFTENGKRY